MASSKITIIDRKTITSLRAQIEVRLAQLGEDLGMEFTLGKGTYSDEGFGHFSKLSIKVIGGTSEEELNFMSMAHLYGMEASDFGMEFTQRSDTYTLCGLKPQNRKFPFLAKKASDGKVYKFTEDGMVRIKAIEGLRAKSSK